MDEILLKSLEKNSSSHTNIFEENIKAEHVIITQENIKIPQRYNQTKIVFLPVDPYEHFIYWDIEDSLYKKIGEKRIKAVLFSSGEKRIDIDIKKQYGEYYIKFYAPFEEVFVSVGYYENNSFIEIAKSNSFILPSDMIFEGDEIFVHKKDFKDIKMLREKLKNLEKSKGKKVEALISKIIGISSKEIL